MTWFDYILIAFWILGTLLVVGSVGKPKQPTTPTVAAIIVCINGLFITGLLFTRGVLG